MSVKDVTSRYPIALVWPRLATSPTRVDAIAIHHSVTPTLAATASEADELATLDSIHRYHRDTRGFLGIGYHICVFPSGRSYLTCKLTQWGANVGGENDHVYGVCFIGTFTNALPSSKHISAAAEAVTFIDNFLKRKVALHPHNYWGSTTCPGKVADKINTIRSAVPVPVPTTVWSEVKAISKTVQLYTDTNLVALPKLTFVKKLLKGTSLAVGGIWRNTHYISKYSMTNQIPNGFAVSATVAPAAPTCQAEKARIATLTTELDSVKKALAAANTRANMAEATLKKIRDLLP
jgi:hypothetical protein